MRIFKTLTRCYRPFIYGLPQKYINFHQWTFNKNILFVVRNVPPLNAYMAATKWKFFSNLIWCSVVLSCPRWWEVEQFSQLLEQGYELVKSVFKPFYKRNWGIHSIQVHIWILTSYVGHWTQDPWCLLASHVAENNQIGESINNLAPTSIFPTLQSTNRHDILVCP